MHSDVAVSTRLSFFTLAMICFAGLGGILYGYDIGVISGALLLINQTIPMTQSQLGFIVGAVLSGGMISTLITGPLADRYGRRIMIIWACIVFVFGLFIILFAHSFVSLLVSRLLLGVGVGIIAVAVPLYLSEVAPASIRGRSMTIFQLLLTVGILLAYIVDLLFIPTQNWRGMFGVIFIPVGILVIGMYFLPETPRFLMTKGKAREAKDILMRTREQREADNEFQEIVESLKITHGTWATLFERCFWVPLFVATMVAILNQLTGINVLLQYAPLVIKNAGLSSQAESMWGTIGIGAVNCIGTILSFFMVDRFGRRKLLLAGTTGIIIAYVYLALLSHWVPAGHFQAMLALVGLFGYIVFFAVGPGVVVWLVISELLPTKVRGRAVALCLFVNSVAAAVLSTFFLDLQAWLGMSGTYLLFAGFTLLYFLVVYFGLVETKNKTLEEIQFHYQKGLEHGKTRFCWCRRRGV